MFATLALRKQSQEDQKFRVIFRYTGNSSLVYVRLCLKWGKKQAKISFDSEDFL